jgi:hypothetical protein
VWKLVCADRQVVVQKTTEEINVDRDVVGTIWTENFGMTMVSAEMVPEILSDDQKQTTKKLQVLISHPLAERTNIFCTVFLGGESLF